MSASMESPSRLSAAPPSLRRQPPLLKSRSAKTRTYGTEKSRRSSPSRKQKRCVPPLLPHWDRESLREQLGGRRAKPRAGRGQRALRGAGGGGRAPVALGQKNNACGSAKVTGAPNPLADVLPQVLQEKLMSWTPADCTLDTSGASEAKLRGQYESL
ncbi:PREDICTED: uncharacterized protein LOC108499541 isoform X2 [Lepidothrix coronata]|uniref:Uncharacterized protein LOC108499541 isoform X2 n=1 Tax=Lepidothrix coronata TaxID=321398 RepID=A0A6J0HK80_9PASS|nr:PREDICTED: uncharacterized protein LOC108499541 isoform X2 [Lepidothrix coronata]